MAKYLAYYILLNVYYMFCQAVTVAALLYSHINIISYFDANRSKIYEVGNHPVLQKKRLSAQFCPKKSDQKSGLTSYMSNSM